MQVDGARWTAVVVVGVAAVVVWAVARHAFVDDAYITLTYARNLAFHGRWGVTPHITSNTATSPLNVMLIALATVFTRDAAVGMGVVFVACEILLYDALRRVAETTGLPRWFALLAAGLIVMSPLTISSIGLDAALGTTLVCLLLADAGEHPMRAGAMAGLVILTRVDLAILALPILLGTGAARRRWRTSAAATTLVAVPWFVFSWFAFGSAVPDTLLIKLQQRAWPGGYEFANGWERYLAVYPAATVFVAVPALAGLVALIVSAAVRVSDRADVRRLDALAPLGIGGVLHFLAYSLLGVPPYHWYYAPSVNALTVFAAAAAGTLATRAPDTLSHASRVVSASCAIAAVLLVGADIGLLPGNLRPLEFAPITTNWASSAEYARIGGELRQLIGESAVTSPGEVGALAYFCQCTILDAFSDPGYIPDLIEQNEAAHGPLGRALIEANYEHFDRTAVPREAAYALRYVHTPGRHAIAVWPVRSPWVGEGDIELDMRTLRQ